MLYNDEAGKTQGVPKEVWYGSAWSVPALEVSKVSCVANGKIHTKCVMKSFTFDPTKYLSPWSFRNLVSLFKYLGSIWSFIFDFITALK